MNEFPNSIVIIFVISFLTHCYIMFVCHNPFFVIPSDHRFPRYRRFCRYYTLRFNVLSPISRSTKPSISNSIATLTGCRRTSGLKEFTVHTVLCTVYHSVR
ncbi:hypothetical protein KC19_VG304900 [Ceratodon purpureus]|uniref:Uncharacterized protein n=1 Tax=Ceratodon purpureus TaxID=3225 RepID=A0A8T0HX29_CERPU|nr:hypothetical protein KC19_VG304900 [Ceratodon purpureus]